MPPKKSKQAKKRAAAASTVNTDTNNNNTANHSGSVDEDSDMPDLVPNEAVPVQEEEPEMDPLVKAEMVKEQGNVAFKAKRYQEAIDLYSKAIDLNPTNPSYLTNRAASYMSLKRFRSALADCNLASSLPSPAPKTLLRLARCHFALGSFGPASSTLRSISSLTPAPTPAEETTIRGLQAQIAEVESHARRYEQAKEKQEWGLARLALDRCSSGIEAIGEEVPIEWRVGKVELEVARGSWEAAANAANDALRTSPSSPEVLLLRGLVLFLTSRLPLALQHVTSALRLDPSHTPARQLRKRIQEVERLKEEGNRLFKGGEWTAAVERYGEAIDIVGSEEKEGKGGLIRATLLSNRATTLLKLERYEEALADTTASLDLSPSSFKALRTRARIYMHLENFTSSIADFKSALPLADTEADTRAMRSELKKAEAALKRANTKDYYKILGIARDASDADVKKGYRRESLKHHPDKGGDEEKFKLVVEAHTVLSDRARRERYDLGEDEDGLNDGGGMGGFSGGAGFGGGGVDLADLFAQFHGGGGGFGGGGGGFGGQRGHSHGGFGF